MAFQEPNILAEFDRSWNDKKEKLVLEQGEYQGKKTFTLRLLWQTEDGSWRWARAREDKQGRVWASMSLREKELRDLAKALLDAAEGRRADRLRDQAERAGVKAKTTASTTSRKVSEPDFADDPDDDKIPF